jgi:hypothetical protein
MPCLAAATEPLCASMSMWLIQLNASGAACTASHEEAGANTFPHGGAETYKPFPNLSRGF